MARAIPACPCSACSRHDATTAELQLVQPRRNRWRSTMRLFPVMVLLSLAVNALADTPKMIDVYTSGRDGYHTYRIPGFVVTNAGTILAFAEGRKNSKSDSGDIDMLVKRSTDGG